MSKISYATPMKWMGLQQFHTNQDSGWTNRYVSRENMFDYCHREWVHRMDEETDGSQNCINSSFTRQQTCFECVCVHKFEEGNVWHCRHFSRIVNISWKWNVMVRWFPIWRCTGTCGWADGWWNILAVEASKWAEQHLNKIRKLQK